MRLLYGSFPQRRLFYKSLFCKRFLYERLFYKGLFFRTLFYVRLFYVRLVFGDCSMEESTNGGRSFEGYSTRDLAVGTT